MYMYSEAIKTRQYASRQRNFFPLLDSRPASISLDFIGRF